MTLSISTASLLVAMATMLLMTILSRRETKSKKKEKVSIYKSKVDGLITSLREVIESNSNNDTPLAGKNQTVLELFNIYSQDNLYKEAIFELRQNSILSFKKSNEIIAREINAYFHEIENSINKIVLTDEHAHEDVAIRFFYDSNIEQYEKIKDNVEKISRLNKSLK